MQRHPMGVLLAGGVAVVALAGIVLAALGGPVPTEATIGGHWSLLRDDGVRVSDRDFRGRYMLLYFGYTSCPDVCPTTLASVADAMRDLGPEAAHIQPVFITVDPRHDTQGVIHRYVRQFSPRLVGLTGTANEISAVEARFNIHAAATEGEAMEHDAVLLLVGPNGTYLGALPVSESGPAIAQRLQSYTRLSRL